MNEVDYTEIRDQRIRTKICELMSEMLDNPDKLGIFPTSRFMWKMETFILAENAKPKELLRLTKNTLNKLAKTPPFTAHMSHNLDSINKGIDEVLNE